MKREHLAALTAGLALSNLCAGPTIPAPKSQQTASTQQTRSGASGLRQWTAEYGRLPLAFEANTGQTDRRVKFLSRGRGYTVFLTGDEAVLALPKAADAAWTVKSARGSVGHPEAVESSRPALDGVLRMKLVGANVNEIVAVRQLALQPREQAASILAGRLVVTRLRRFH